MHDLYLKIGRSFLVFVMFFTTPVFAQLSDFNFSVTPTNETCSGNGSVSFAVSGTTAGASMFYSIYQLPDTTDPLTVTSALSYSGLTAGTYLIIATQSLGNQTGSQQAQVVITNAISTLSYAVNNEIGPCGLSANIVVDVESGNAVSYEILSGPQTFPPQSQNIFTVNQGGVYLIRVTDACGEALVQTYTFSFSPGSGAGFSSNASSSVVSCNLISVTQNFEIASGFNYPLEVSYTLVLPGGETQSSVAIIEEGGNNSVTLVENLIISVGESYTYSVTVVDSCGNTFTDSGTIESEFQEPILSPAGLECDTASYAIYFTTAATVTVAPEAYQNELPFELAVSQNTALMPELPPGNYVVIAYDICGEPHELEVTVTEPVPVEPVVLIELGCESGRGSLNIRAFKFIVSIQMISAPAGYSQNLPLDLAANLDSANSLRLSNLPAGNYLFHILDSCGNEWDLTVEMPALVVESEVSVTQNCGSFNLSLAYSDNSASPATFWLQKFYPALNAWGHPQTGVLYVDGNAPTAVNSYSLLPGSTLNLLFSGKLRVFSYEPAYSVIPSERHCLNILEEFDILTAPIILDAYAFSCAGNNFDVVIDAVGMAPLSYAITQFSGGPFEVDNGNSPVFTDLAPGIYNFRVVDVCGNIVNRLLEINEPYPMAITAVGNCEGQPIMLSVPNLAHLNYSWYQANPDTELSTSASLEIPSFSDSNLGTYYVTISTDDPESCINDTLSYTVSEIIALAASGENSAQDYCGSPGMIDLNTFLSGNFQTDGTWSGNAGSGLTGNLWDAAMVENGTYSFAYTTTSECSPDSVSNHIFTLNPRPENPVPFLEQQVCDQGDIQLLTTTIAGATYMWTGPDGFTATQQNPIVSNVTTASTGIYTVQAFIGDCASDVMPLEITIGELPQFEITAACLQDKMMLSANAVTQGDAVTVSWSGPDGFSASENPADITGQAPGDYMLTITNASGCTETVTQFVSVTLCTVPKGVSANGDGANDSFDLSGFGDGLKVKIFNRYGMTVYEMDNYVNQWRGQSYNGHDLPSATYYYQIQSETGDEKTGWVYLMRD